MAQSERFGAMTPDPRAIARASVVPLIAMVASYGLVSTSGGAIHLVGKLVAYAVLLAGAVAIAAHWPVGVAQASLCAIVVIPAYYSRVSSGIVVSPSAAMALILGGGVIVGGHASRLRLNRWDALFLTAEAAVVFSMLSNYTHTRALVVNLMLATIVPYFTFRALARDPATVRRLQWSLVVAAAALAPIALLERLGTPNPFFTLMTPTYGLDYAEAAYRAGGVRAEGSFGQPLVFGMFLAMAFTLAVHLLLTTRRRALAVVLSSAIAVALIATNSRSPLAFAAGGVLLLLWGRRRQVRWGWVLLVAALVIPLLLTTSVGRDLTEMVRSIYSTGDASAAASGRYRSFLFQRLLSRQDFTWLGTPTGVDPYATAGARGALGSIDNELLFRFLAFGAVATIAFFGLIVVVVVRALRRDSSDFQGAVVAVAVGGLILLNLALLLQVETLFFVLLGIAASGASRKREASAEQLVVA